jgi:short-subunit dehydrogenase
MNIDRTDNYLITGATSDIGYSLLDYLARKTTAKVLAVSRSSLDTSRITLSSQMKCVAGIDLLNRDNLALLRSITDQYFSEPFTLIHCVGNFWHHKPLAETPLDEAESMILSHYLTLYNVASILLPLMVVRNGGRIIAFSCNSVSYNYPDMAAFTSAKAAVETLIKCIANEHSRHNVVSNAFALSTILTEKVIQEKDKQYHAHYMTPDELCELVVEDIANSSQFLNGNVIKLLKYSPFYYKEGYYTRNRIHTQDDTSHR